MKDDLKTTKKLCEGDKITLKEPVGGINLVHT